MALLELLVSPPGTGKTTHCIDLFKAEILKSRAGIENSSVFILPSREHAERIQNLILKTGVSGLFNAHVMTINEFAGKLLGSSAAASPNEAIRKGILRGVLKSEEGRFGFFQEVCDLPGFRDLLSDTLKEFKASLLDTSEFEKLCQSLLSESAFRSKFRDFCMVLKRYEQGLSAMHLREPEDNIRVLLRSRSFHRIPLVIFDGFYHFTRAQSELIRLSSHLAKRMVVTLTIGAGPQARQHLFEYPLRTKKLLMGMGFKTAKVPFKKNRRTLDKALIHLEKNIFSPRAVRTQSAVDTVMLIEARDVRHEIEAVAREIKRLYRETPLHYSDICIILRSLGGYERMLETLFRDFGLPVHVHERRKLIENPLGVFVWRIFRLFIENWKREDLFYVLKSSFLVGKLDAAAVLALETAARRDNVIEGYEAWAGLLERVPDTAKETVRYLRAAEEDLKKACHGKEFASLWMNFMRSLQNAVSSLDEADAHAMKTVESLLKDAVHFYESQEAAVFSPMDFMKEISELLEAALFSLKPKGRNRVQVYDVVMALPKEYKVVFMAGLLEKSFPQEIREDALFKDEERRVINKKGVVLEERSWRAAGERYFFYMGLMRAKERLYLSYPLFDGEGRAALPSFFVEEVKKCFKTLPLLRKESSPLGWLASCETEKDVTRALARWLFLPSTEVPAASRQILALAKEWMGRASFRQVLETGFKAGHAAAIESDEAKAYFGALKGPFSATRLETYATCAFKYFASKVLCLSEPLEGREALEMGNLLHKTLEEYYQALSAQERKSGAFLQDEAEARQALWDLLDQQMQTSPFRNEPAYRQKIYRESMRDALSLFVAKEKELFGRRRLVPSHFELGFGRDDGKKSLGFLKIEGDSGEISIQGQIDRVDVTPDGKKALVIDYKRSKRDVTISKKLAKGLELQLPIYLLATQKLLKLTPLGAELRLLRDGTTEGLYTEEAREVLGLDKRRKVKSAEEMEKTLEESEALIRNLVERLKTADIRVNPKSCKHCHFDSVCRFEPWRLVYSEPD